MSIYSQLSESQLLTEYPELEHVEKYYDHPKLTHKFLKHIMTYPSKNKYLFECLNEQIIRYIYRKFNPNDLIELFYIEGLDDIRFMKHFSWNERLNEKHLEWMFENKIPIQWSAVSMSEEISFHYIIKTWNQLMYQWNPIFMTMRKDLIYEMYQFLLSKCYDTYIRMKVIQNWNSVQETKLIQEAKLVQKGKKNYHLELECRPPYTPIDPPVFKHVVGIEYTKCLLHWNSI